MDSKSAIKQHLAITNSSEHPPEAEHQRLGIGAVEPGTNIRSHAVLLRYVLMKYNKKTYSFRFCCCIGLHTDTNRTARMLLSSREH